MNQFILYNGEFFSEKEKLFDQHLLNKKIFTERVKSIRSILPFWTDHIQLLLLKFKIHNFTPPSFLLNKGAELKRQIERTLTKNKLFKSAVITLSLFPDQNKTSYLISAKAENSNEFQLNKNGVIVEIFDKIPKAISPLSRLAEGSEPFWRMIDSEQKQVSDIISLLTNTNGSILEACMKNIYLLKGTQLLTPSSTTGAFVDISMKIIKRICENLELEFIEVNQLDKSDLLIADEAFLCNCTTGIEWIKGFENKRYYCKMTRLLNEEFNRMLIQ